jgi:hypothetical protein
MKYQSTEEEFKKIVLCCKSIADVCRSLNVRPTGGNYKTVKSKILLWNVNTDHFTGQGWNVGKRFKSFCVKIPLSDILIENSTYTNSDRLKIRLYNEGIKEKKCEKCGLSEWLNEKITFELHHCNGNNLDHRIENLKILCPNCHSQTENFRKNLLSVRNEHRKIKYSQIVKEKINSGNTCECGKKIKRDSKYCTKCYGLKHRKIDRPDINSIIEEVKLFGYRTTGKKYGVSDNSIRKWIKN